MQYKRFLTDYDYLAVITQEHLNQLIRDVHDRFISAEEAAEMSMREYLDQYYEIEKEFAKGKCIREYSNLINYPAGVYFKKDERIYRTLTSINGLKKPSSLTYWRVCSDFRKLREIDHIHPYLQTKTYQVGDLVKYSEEVWECVVANGWDFRDIRIPGVISWKEVDTEEFKYNVEYAVFSVVSFEGSFYMLSSKDDEYDTTITPFESKYWGMIGDYSDEYEYSCEKDAHDYTVYDGKVFVPFINPNADSLKENVNMVLGDPRNLNVVKRMRDIALYNLHVTISPTNISETRRAVYEDAMDWLYKASKFKLNPQIPRKIDKADDQPLKDWALADFQRDFNPTNDAWLI